MALFWMSLVLMALGASNEVNKPEAADMKDVTVVADSVIKLLDRY